MRSYENVHRVLLLNFVSLNKKHKLEERQEFNRQQIQMFQQLPITDPEISKGISEKRIAEDDARRNKYQAEWNLRFRSRAIEYREELCRRDGIFPPYLPDIRSTAALDHGLLPGINPVSQVSDYLDELIRKLPN